LDNLNLKVAQQNPNLEFKVALNLSDDLKGGWTNHFTSDYDSKFKLKGFVNKNFCIPVFGKRNFYSKRN